MNIFSIENRPIINTTKELAFQTLIQKKEQIVKYKIVEPFEIINLPAFGFEDDFYFFDYQISKREDAITNIIVESSSKIKLLFDGYWVDIPVNYYLYNCLFTFTNIILRIYFDKNHIGYKFKISYDGYMFNSDLRRALISKNYRDLTNWLEEIKL